MSVTMEDFANDGEGLELYKYYLYSSNFLNCSHHNHSMDEKKSKKDSSFLERLYGFSIFYYSESKINVTR